MEATNGPVAEPASPGPVLGDPVLDDPVLDDPVLGDPVRAALDGEHAALAERHGTAARYLPAVSPFTAIPRDQHGWDDLAGLVGPGGQALLRVHRVPAPPGWEVTWTLPGVQMVLDDDRPTPVAGSDLVVLGPTDVDEMLDLVVRTDPGPFARRTVELGSYLGYRDPDDGRLLAMAGERMRPPGATEISAVCTDPDARGRGLATRLIHTVAAGIRARGETPFLHAAGKNTPAIRLYEQLGFRLVARPEFVRLAVVQERP